MAQRDIEASQRATAKMLGVDEGTIRGDLGKRSAENSAVAEVDPAEMLAPEGGGAENSAPAWFQDDVDPAKLAKLSDEDYKAWLDTIRDKAFPTSTALRNLAKRQTAEQENGPHRTDAVSKHERNTAR